MTSAFSGWLPSQLPPNCWSLRAASWLTATVAASDPGFNSRSSDPQAVFGELGVHQLEVVLDGDQGFGPCERDVRGRDGELTHVDRDRPGDLGLDACGLGLGVGGDVLR